MPPESETKTTADLFNAERERALKFLRENGYTSIAEDVALKVPAQNTFTYVTIWNNAAMTSVYVSGAQKKKLIGYIINGDEFGAIGGERYVAVSPHNLISPTESLTLMKRESYDDALALIIKRHEEFGCYR
jgi:hypothetical protein